MKSQNETRHIQRRRHLIVALVLLFTVPAQAMIPALAYDNYASTELINPITQEIDLSTLSMLSRVSDPYRFNMANYIPLKGLPDSDSGDRVARRILQHTMQNIFDNQREQYAGALASAQKMNQNMKTTVGSEKNSLLLRFRPFETRGEIIYKGELPVASSISYLASQNELRFEVSRQVFDKTVAYTHVSATDQQKDLIGVRWNF